MLGEGIELYPLGSGEPFTAFHHGVEGCGGSGGVGTDEIKVVI